MRNPDQELLAAYQQGEMLPIDTNPMAHMLGAKLISLDRVVGSIRIDYEPGQGMSNAEGTLDIGATAAMLDFALGFVALATVDSHERIATATLQLHLLEEPRPGRLTATAAVEGRSSKVIFTRGSLTSAAGLLFATAASALPVLEHSPQRA